MGTLDDARELLAFISVEHGLSLELLHGFTQGETRSAHLVRGSDGREWILKWAPATRESRANLERLVGLVDGLRGLGYPAPTHLVVGVAGEVAYWVQERLPGEPIHASPRAVPGDEDLARLVPTLVALVDLHADRGDLTDPPWPAWLIETLEVGGDGYCLHDTMLSSPDTARMLEEIKAIAASCREATVRRHDIVHFDFSYANVLTDGSSVTGVIDWNVPFAGALQGDRAFDLATLLFYAYDKPRTRDVLWAALLERADLRSSALYLAHLTLRQVEWVNRFYPDSFEHDRFMTIGRKVLDDLARHW